MKMPHYDLCPDTGRGALMADFKYQTAICGRVVAIPYVVLGADGQLFIRAGYCWDFGSGPAIDTPEMVAASLAHDALYDLIKLGQLDNGHRKAADKYFRQLLKDYGVGWFRRNYCYWAVRLFGGGIR